MMRLNFCLSVFVCFKRQTAYEMRISDWSSDVCSSDLKAAQADGLGERERMPGPGFLLGGGDDPDIVRKGAGDRFQHLEAGCVHPIVVGEKNPHQIGRASLRERVCQYV